MTVIEPIPDFSSTVFQRKPLCNYRCRGLIILAILILVISGNPEAGQGISLLEETPMVKTGLKLHVDTELQVQNLRLMLDAAVIALMLTGGIALVFYHRYRAEQRKAEQYNITNRLLTIEHDRLLLINEKLGRFGSVVSHDILNNLDLIQSAGNVFVGPRPEKSSLIQYYHITRRASQQLREYCLSLLESARSHSAETRQLTQPEPIVRAVLEQFQPALLQTGLNVQIMPLSPLALPPAVIEQIARNLLSNTLRHGATASQPQLRITERKTPSGSFCWIIEDNGPGIPPEKRLTLFSSGRGLYLLRNTLLDYEADIQVDERPGGGTRWMIFFSTSIRNPAIITPEKNRKLLSAKKLPVITGLAFKTETAVAK